jgi:S-adenosylmethionine synthetase
MTRTEKIVLETEKYVNSSEFKRRFPESGEDVKVMAFRDRNDLKLTVAMAFVDRFISSEEDYFEKKEKILEDINKYVAVNTDFEPIVLTGANEGALHVVAEMVEVLGQPETSKNQ